MKTLLLKMREAAISLREQRRNPEDVACGVRSIDAFAQLVGRGDETMLKRMKKSETGRRLLAEREPVLDFLCDRERLRRLPEGSVGRAYLHFLESHQLFPERLAAIVAEAPADSGGLIPNATSEIAYLHDRFRDLHDLWHVLTGYETDMGGELGLHGFQTQQNGYRAMALLSFFSCLAIAARGRPDLFLTWFRGRRRGRRAAFLMEVDLDALLPLPLDRAREELGLTPLPVYRPYSYSPELSSRSQV